MSIFSVPCLMGVESLVADELSFMGLQNVRAENGRVLFEGGMTECAAVNIGMRCGERVLLRVAAFPATTFDELFEGVKAGPWSEFIGESDAFPIKGSSLKSKLHSVPACQSIIKKAIVENLRAAYKTQTLAETGAKKQVQFFIMNDHAEIFLDTTGAPLYRRGYKLEQNLAAIRETLAASLVKLSRFTGRTPFIDPMCGSGTIVIEAAQAALKIAPGLNRDFDAQNWNGEWANAFLNSHEQAKARKIDLPLEMHASDIDAAAVEMSKKNAHRAGVAEYINFTVADVKHVRFPDRGTLICNPPYGERMLDICKAQELYAVLGQRILNIPELKKYIISSDDRFEEHFGQRSDKRRKLYNGMIKCNLYMYFKGKV